jgi:lysophospholipase L1-like esterase
MARIALIGDSQGTVLFPIVAPRLNAIGDQVVYTTANTGWSITTYNQKMPDLWDKLRAAEPDYVVVELGTNSWGVPSIYASQMSDWIQRIRGIGAEPIWIGPGAVTPPASSAVQRGVQDIRTIQKRVANKLNVPWLDSAPLTQGLNRPDGIHHTPSDNQVWAQAVFPFIVKNTRGGALAMLRKPKNKPLLYGVGGAVGLLALALLIRNLRG